ncbi:hypothetical protein GCM10027425_08270 [Alteromonas gracilis]
MSYDPPPPPQYGAPGPGPYGAAPSSNSKATWALVTGVLGLCCGPAGIAGIVLGIIARKEIKESHGMQTGAGLATAGIVVGSISLILGVLSFGLMSAGIIENPFTTGMTAP